MEDTMRTRTSFLGAALALVVLLLGASSVLAQAQLTDCMECHNDTTLITGKQFAWEESLHGSGHAAAYAGGRGSCTACHSGASFSAMIAAGQNPSEFREVVDVTRQDCRACHQIHTSYTTADWALETYAPVTLYAFESATFAGGKGNLCANCHQPRRTIDGYVDDVNGVTDVTSTHWGPHHGPQSAMLLGIGGGGDVAGKPSAHSMLVQDTCVTCHLGENDGHTFEAVQSSCTQCHPDADDFDINGVQTEVAALIAQVGERLVAKGMLDEEGHPVVGTYPSAEAAALWDYIFIAIEDGSLGVHNPAYTKGLLEKALEALE
jgi:hypothetical protein